MIQPNRLSDKKVIVRHTYPEYKSVELKACAFLFLSLFRPANIAV